MVTVSSHRGSNQLVTCFLGCSRSIFFSLREGSVMLKCSDPQSVSAAGQSTELVGVTHCWPRAEEWAVFLKTWPQGRCAERCPVYQFSQICVPMSVLCACHEQSPVLLTSPLLLGNGGYVPLGRSQCHGYVCLRQELCKIF